MRAEKEKMWLVAVRGGRRMMAWRFGADRWRETLQGTVERGRRQAVYCGQRLVHSLTRPTDPKQPREVDTSEI